MSNFRNVIRRREHRERGQPAKRQKLGLLEKHKDYVQRARNFHGKERRLRKLKIKAANRNPDEFNFGMVKSKTTGGVHNIAHEGGRVSADMQKLLDTQSGRYAAFHRTMEGRKIEKLQAAQHGLGGEKSNTHTLFAESAAEAKLLREMKKAAARALAAGAKQHGSKRARAAAAAAARRAAERDGSSSEEDEEGSEGEAGAIRAGSAAPPPLVLAALPKRLQKQQRLAAKELAERKQRHAKLDTLCRTFETRKNLQSKGRRRKVKDAQGDEPAQFKWKAERKR